jgi:hypothetical protein
MRHWLNDCQERHPSCRGTTTGKAKLPARVIDVGDPIANGLPHVFLYVTKGEEGSYTALSHCWGQGKPLSTTKSTIADHEKLITFDAASTTFAQAAEVTRALGIRYLWYLLIKTYFLFTSFLADAYRPQDRFPLHRAGRLQ